MAPDLVLASGSPTRRMLLENAGITVHVEPARIDEAALRDSAISENVKARDIADMLAEHKARRVAGKLGEGIVLGCDQVLVFGDGLLSKPDTPEALRAQLGRLNGNSHELLSAAVIYDGGRPVWRHVGRTRMHMRQASPAYLDDYIARNWDTVRHSVGGYQIEGEGIRLFQRIEGDYFHVLGLPLTEILVYLTQRGIIDG